MIAATHAWGPLNRTYKRQTILECSKAVKKIRLPQSHRLKIAYFSDDHDGGDLATRGYGEATARRTLLHSLSRHNPFPKCKVNFSKSSFSIWHKTFKRFLEKTTFLCFKKLAKKTIIVSILAGSFRRTQQSTNVTCNLSTESFIIGSVNWWLIMTMMINDHDYGFFEYKHLHFWWARSLL